GARDLAHEVGALHLPDTPRLLDQLLRVDGARRDDAAQHAAAAQLPRERARVHFGDRDDAVRHEVLAQRLVGAPAARHGRRLADDEAGDLRLPRLVVGAVDAVVADL